MSKQILPLQTIGIMGGGQLARMIAIAAAEYGYKVHIYSSEENCPAKQVANKTIVGAYDDMMLLEEFAKEVDVITFEFENIPYKPMQTLAKKYPIAPSPDILGIAQNRLKEKSFFNELGIQTARWAEIKNIADLEKSLAEYGYNSILKTAEQGYDGKGQIRIKNKEDYLSKQSEITALIKTGRELILEEFVVYDKEVSLISARNEMGEYGSFDLVWNQHEEGILKLTIAASDIGVNAEIKETAANYNKLVSEKLGLVGLLTVEYFVKDNKLYANEMAPRPHNSGHWTLDGAIHSQFAQLIRAICGLKLGSFARKFNNKLVLMYNLLGDDVIDIGQKLSDFPEAKFYIYGKEEVRSGRKMGHVNII